MSSPLWEHGSAAPFTVYARLVKTMFMLKPLEARNAADGTNTDRQTDVATSILNWPRCQVSKKINN